jgi:hypothetical protein
MSNCSMGPRVREDDVFGNWVERNSGLFYYLFFTSAFLITNHPASKLWTR